MPITPLKGMVYIAGPITLGVREENIANAIKVGSELIEKGWAAFLPQLHYFWNDIHPFIWEEWLSYDFCVIERCVAIIRLPGESKGADAEVNFTYNIGKTVYYSIEAFLDDEEFLLFKQGKPNS